RTTLQAAIRQVISVPELFGEHPTLVGKLFYCLDEGHRIAADRQFVMAAFSRQNRPAATDARPIEGAAIILFPVAIVIVATPAGALWQVAFEDPIDDFDWVAHDRIVWTANAESHEVKAS